MGFCRQEYWSGLPFPSAGNLPNPGIEPGSLALQADSILSEPQGKLRCSYQKVKNLQLVDWIIRLKSLEQWFSVLWRRGMKDGNLLPKLAVSWDIVDYQSFGGGCGEWVATAMYWVEAQDMATYPRTIRQFPSSNDELSDSNCQWCGGWKPVCTPQRVTILSWILVLHCLTICR